MTDPTPFSSEYSEINVDDGLLDGDVTKLKDMLDDAYTKMSSNALSHVGTFKQRILAENAESLRQRDHFYMAQIEKQQAAFDALTDKLAKQEISYNAKIEKMEQVVDTVAEMHERKRVLFTDEYATKKIFIHWYRSYQDRKKERSMNHILNQIREKDSRTKTFATFRREYIRTAIETERRRAREEKDEVTTKLIQKYELELNRLRKEVCDVHAVARNEQYRRQQLEEDLRRTFLKNMTNMNMEALQLFKNSNGAANSSSGSISGNSLTMEASTTLPSPYSASTSSAPPAHQPGS